MDTSAIIMLLTVSLFCFTFIFWLKKSENKYKYKKTKIVDIFIRRNNINVHNIYVGPYFDLVNDQKKRTIWFFYIQKNTLHYKRIPYEDLFFIEYKLDRSTIKSVVRTGQLKRDLVVGNEQGKVNETMENISKDVDHNYRVKEIMITIVIDELQPATLDLLFGSSHFPVEVSRVKDYDAKAWFTLFTEIIKQENEREL